MILKIAVCDDNDKDIEIINRELLLLEEKAREKGCTYQIQAFKSGNDILKSFALVQDMHILFLDIDMPGLSGIQLASKFRDKGLDTTLVFVSSHDDFVFETFRYNAYRFVRKNKLISDTQEMIFSFCAALKTKSVIVRLDSDQQRTLEQKVSDIAYFYSIRHDIYFVNAQKESVAMHTYTMNELEKQFTEKGFIRVHKSYLMNYTWILQIKGDWVYLKANHDKIPLSRGRSEEVKLQYQRLMREEGVL